MKTLRITVDGTAYDVTVEVLDDGGAAPTRPAAPATPAAPAAPRPVAAPAAAPAPAPAAAPAAAAGSGDVVSPLAGTVVSVDVKVGDAVAAGQQLVVLEAMKMNTPIQAPRAGTVSAVSAQAGESVAEGQVLLSLS
ncbi:biotin/lipoyl-containing protein [Roseospira visakhapatnamensis]|uniref:Biotin carboxyl carrier protein n=1 Tax=Roseospira visakhapatnamensis TaxID=390880 RepID=A0A7W6REE9_9PROT|nr:biotin/lipoyl-containing protein [Roseospira visakhapatnamensis]MBB4266963.1 biotin carboxyl carrier protein [Roseospira visakhapatnamensis]